MTHRIRSVSQFQSNLIDSLQTRIAVEFDLDAGFHRQSADEATQHVMPVDRSSGNAWHSENRLGLRQIRKNLAGGHSPASEDLFQRIDEPTEMTKVTSNL
ncbi:hypothetical protein [Rosistilla oblonga]|uniref:hypothetical protein n=1 Tax=Rosistilla oblonga TaxID=2527990 RepID=UPI0011A0AAAA|nr:hypothetical protein [Rosistilla oblonga]